MLDNIFIIKFTENLTENKKLCKAIGHPKRYYEAYLSHIVFELWPFTTFTGWKINFDKIILISQFIIIQHRRWQKFVKNFPNSKWWQDRVKGAYTGNNWHTPFALKQCSKSIVFFKILQKVKICCYIINVFTFACF